MSRSRLVAILLACLLSSACFDGLDDPTPDDREINQLDNPGDFYRSGDVLTGEHHEVSVSVHPYGPRETQSEGHRMTFSGVGTTHELESILWTLIIEADGV